MRLKILFVLFLIIALIVIGCSLDKIRLGSIFVSGEVVPAEGDTKPITVEVKK